MPDQTRQVRIGDRILSIPVNATPDDIKRLATNETKLVRIGEQIVTVPYDVTPDQLHELGRQMNLPVHVNPEFDRSAGAMMDASMGYGGGSIDPTKGRLAPVALPLAGSTAGLALTGGAGLLPAALASGTGYGLGKAASGSDAMDAITGGIENAVLTGAAGAGAQGLGKIWMALKQPSAAAAAQTITARNAQAQADYEQQIAQIKKAADESHAATVADWQAQQDAQRQQVLDAMKPTQIVSDRYVPSGVVDATGKPIMTTEPWQFEKPSQTARDLQAQARNLRDATGAGVVARPRFGPPDAPPLDLPPRPVPEVAPVTGPSTRGGELLQEGLKQGAKGAGFGLVYEALSKLFGGN